MLRPMTMRRVGTVALVALSLSACGGSGDQDAALGTSPAPSPTYLSVELDCDGGPTQSAVVDYVPEAKGQPTPEEAASQLLSFSSNFQPQDYEVRVAGTRVAYSKDGAVQAVATIASAAERTFVATSMERCGSTSG